MSECDLSDTIEHHPTMTRYASECDVIVEFGVHLGGSARAFLRGVREALHSWDIEACAQAVDGIRDPKWHFHQGDSRTADVPACDMLYIDSDHTDKQVTAELAHAADKARKWIMFHDTETCRGEVCPPILRFLAAHPEWSVGEHFTNNNGLTILERTCV